MNEQRTSIKGFVYLTCVTISPGNPVKPVYQRVAEIVSITPCSEEYTRIGASASISLRSGDYMLITEHFEDIVDAISIAMLKEE